MNKKTRNSIARKLFGQGVASPTKSLLDADRGIAVDDEWAEYGFLDIDADATDDEVNDYVREYITISPSAPGEFGTLYISWYRNPCGLISFTHYLGYDI